MQAWIDEAVAGGAKVATGGDVDDDGCSRPTVLTDVLARHEGVQPGGVRPGGRGPALPRRRRRASGSPTTTRYGLQAAIFTPDLALALRAARELDFGGVLVNEVPTWRADQMPYGGVRDSGNTREGPAYAVHEMTETRLVVIDA